MSNFSRRVKEETGDYVGDTYCIWYFMRPANRARESAARISICILVLQMIFIKSLSSPTSLPTFLGLLLPLPS
jgi:hypothetical protein